MKKWERLQENMTKTGKNFTSFESNASQTDNRSPADTPENSKSDHHNSLIFKKMHTSEHDHAICHARRFRVRAPGRICLLGEHQDYLGLEVISGAMNLAVTFDATELTPCPSEKNATPATFTINLTQTGETREIVPAFKESPEGRDYLLSGLHVMSRQGLTFSTSWDIKVTGDLPIGKGVSSSSALCVGWIALLNSISDDPINLSALQIAHLAFQTEVLEFNEPGGMQDHLASALGGLIHLNFNDQCDQIPDITSLEPVPTDLLLVDSGETKETIGMIARIRSAVERQANALWQTSTPSLSTRLISDISRHSEVPELQATLANRDQVRRAVTAWKQAGATVPAELSHWINAHHKQLCTGIQSSSPTIDAMIEQALAIGASAGKVIGSGGGGCLLIYAPGCAESVATALRKTGAMVWSIEISDGVSVTCL